MHNPAKQLWLGALETLPLVVAAFPFGIVFGALAQSSDLGFWVTLGMSAIVFSGASQFISGTLLASATVLPVIVMTGYADEDTFRKSLQYRVADFLSKPFESKVLRESLRKALGRDDAFADQFLDTVAHRLREARTAQGLKQGEVAARCGLSTSQISQIELRQSSPSITTLLKLCKSLNLTMSELVSGF